VRLPHAQHRVDTNPAAHRDRDPRFAGFFAAKRREKLPAFRVDAEPAEPVQRETGDAAPLEKCEVENVVVRPFTRVQRVILWTYGAVFVVLFCLLEWREAADRLLSSIHPALHAPPLPADFAGQSLGVRALRAISLLAVPFLLSFFPLYAALRGVKVYEQFVEGAKEAWETARRTVPYLVAMLVAIGMLRKAGVIDLLTSALAPALKAVGFPAELLPMVLMRPLSGSATNGLFVELVRGLGEPDGFVSRLAGTIYGSTETTFYVLAIYFGSVSIRRSRHAVAAGLTADFVAVATSTAICTVMFA
jgi:spore maturation protein B